MLYSQPTTQQRKTFTNGTDSQNVAAEVVMAVSSVPLVSVSCRMSRYCRAGWQPYLLSTSSELAHKIFVRFGFAAILLVKTLGRGMSE